MFIIEPIGYVRGTRAQPADDNWDAERASIWLNDSFEPEALDGIEEFSHLEIVYLFDRVEASGVVSGARHPRGNVAWPRAGIFAQRARNRPNRIGTTIVELEQRQGTVLTVRGLDAIDGTPVVDIKPVMAEFLPRTEVRQPGWSHELMHGYWRDAGDGS